MANSFHQIDIIEYVNEAKINQYTLHTGADVECSLDPNATARYKNEDGSQPKSYLGNTLGLECTSSDGNNAGCAVDDFEGSAGAPFNMAGGGVIAMLWDESQVTFWRFERDQIPQDVQDGNPNPDSWGVPVAYWSDKSCNIASAFRDHSSTFRSFSSLVTQDLRIKPSCLLFSYHQHLHLW